MMKPFKEFLAGNGLDPKAMLSTMLLCMKQKFDGGLLCIAGGYLVSAVRFVMLVLIWKALAAGGADTGGMTLDQLLTYTLMASILHQQLDIISPATSALWEGSIIGRFTRPVPVEASFIVETVGRFWILHFLLYGLPLLLAAPLLGIKAGPASPGAGLLALVSLILSVSLGFAIDLMFAAFAIYLKDGCWAATAVRDAAYALLSGELMPFALYPWGLGKIFSFLPLGSIGHAPLAIYVGTASRPYAMVGLQLFWNVALWIAAALIFEKSKERMISFGG